MRKKPVCSRKPASKLGIDGPPCGWGNAGGLGEFLCQCRNKGRCFESSGLFSNNLEGDFNRNLLVEVDFCGVAAKLLNGFFEHDELAVNIVSELLESFGNLNVVDGTEDGAVGGSLGADGESHAFECGGGSLGVSFELRAR